MSFFYLFIPPNCPIESKSSHALFIFFIVAATEGRLEMFSQRQKKKIFFIHAVPWCELSTGYQPCDFFIFFYVILNFWDCELNGCQLERWGSRAFLPHFYLNIFRLITENNLLTSHLTLSILSCSLSN